MAVIDTGICAGAIAINDIETNEAAQEITTACVGGGARDVTGGETVVDCGHAVYTRSMVPTNQPTRLLTRSQCHRASCKTVAHRRGATRDIGCTCGAVLANQSTNGSRRSVDTDR